MIRAELRNEVRKIVRDTDSSDYYWSDTDINNKIDRQLNSPYLLKENEQTYTISSNQIEFTLPTDFPRFSNLYRLYLRDSSTPSNDYLVPTHKYRIFNKKIRFYEPPTSGYTLVLWYFAKPTKPTSDSSTIDLEDEQLDLLILLVADSLLKEDVRPTWETLRLKSIIAEELNRKIQEVGLTAIIY